MILNFLAHLAWPLLVLALVLIFRAPLRALLNEATEVTAFGATLKRTARAARDFKELTAMAAAETATPQAPTGHGALPPELTARLDAILASSIPDPYYAVLTASDAVVRTAQVVTAGDGEPPAWDESAGPAALLRHASAPDDLIAAAAKGWELRHQMIRHEARFDADSAREYAQGAEQLITALEAWAASRT